MPGGRILRRAGPVVAALRCALQPIHRPEWAIIVHPEGTQITPSGAVVSIREIPRLHAVDGRRGSVDAARHASAPVTSFS